MYSIGSSLNREPFQVSIMAEYMFRIFVDLFTSATLGAESIVVALHRVSQNRLKMYCRVTTPFALSMSSYRRQRYTKFHVISGSLQPKTPFPERNPSLLDTGLQTEGSASDINGFVLIAVNNTYYVNFNCESIVAITKENARVSTGIFK